MIQLCFTIRALLAYVLLKGSPSKTGSVGSPSCQNHTAECHVHFTRSFSHVTASCAFSHAARDDFQVPRVAGCSPRPTTPTAPTSPLALLSLGTA